MSYFTVAGCSQKDYHLSGGIKVVEHFLGLRSGLFDVLSGLDESLSFEDNRLHNSLQIAELTAVLI